MSNRFRLVSVFLVAILIVVAGCSIVTLRANAQTPVNYTVLLRQRHQEGACINIGVLTVDQKSYPLPATLLISAGEHSLGVSLYSGCEFVMWEVEGRVIVRDPKAVATVLTVQGDGTVRLVNRGSCCGVVGGLAVETNTFTVFAPYLIAVGLIATAAAVAVKKRRD